MTVIKSRADAVIAALPPLTPIKSIQRGVVSVLSGHMGNVIIATVNPARAKIKLTFRNNIGVVADSSMAAAAAFTGTAEFNIDGGVSNSFILTITEQKLAWAVWVSDSYRNSWLTLSSPMQCHWEVIEYV